MTDDLVKRLRDGCVTGNYEGLEFIEWSKSNATMNEAADRIEALEAALRDVYEVYAGSEGIPQPMTAAEGYLLHLVKEMANTARAALEGKKDD